MFHTLADRQTSHGVRGIVCILCAIAVLLGLPSFSQAKDARSDARAQIRLIQADISKANAEINSRDNRILAGDILIATNELAIAEAKKQPDNEAAVFALQLTLAALKSKKNDLIGEKQGWERYKRESEKALADWEAYLRKLGG